MLKKGEAVVGLLLPGENSPCPGIETVFGNVCSRESLIPLFDRDSEITVIHCAGFVSIASRDGRKMWETNVGGTKHMVDLAQEYGVKKFIYVSSVHAIPELPKGERMGETREFRAELVEGEYGKSKAEATRYVLQAAEKGFPACVVHPSGMLGPYDYGSGQMTEVFRKYIKRQLPVAVEGGYDFTDVRDVAKGIISCCERGRAGECYILSGSYYTIQELLNIAARTEGRRPIKHCIPLSAARRIAPASEWLPGRLGRKASLTAYSAYTLGANAEFSHKKADEELGYSVREIEKTVRDMVKWCRRRK